MVFLKSKLLWAVVAVVSIVAIVFVVRSGSQVEYITEPARLADIVQTVSATGQVKSASEIELNFKNAGRLNVLNFDTGDEVRNGQIIAQLKSTAEQIDVSRASAGLQEAQANLDKVRAGATAEEVAVAQAAAAKAETDLEDAQTKLENVKKTFAQAVDNERSDILADINSALTKANISLQEVDDTINYEGDDDNFKTSNEALKAKVTSDFSISQNEVASAQSSYSAAFADGTDEKIDASASQTINAVQGVEALLEDLSLLLDQVIITSVLTQSELDTLKDNNNTQRTVTDTSLDTLLSAKQNLNDARLDLQVKTEEAENAVSVAEKNLAKAEADLILKRAAARPEDIALWEAKVREALANLRLAQDKLGDTILRAPITGVITEVNYNVGEQTSLTVPVVKMLATENLEIEVDIPESDIAKIVLGDETIITLDAFNEEDEFLGTITTINPAQTEIQDVIYYKIDVGFADEQPPEVEEKKQGIKPGMTTNIEIETDRRTQALVVPSRAVKEQGGERYVEELQSGKPERVVVSTGLRSDDGLIEITGGLNVGQQVIVSVREK